MNTAESKKGVEHLVEDYALKPVPIEKRRSWLDIFIVWLGYCTTVGCMYVGVSLGTNCTFPVAVKYLTIGDILLWVVMACTAYIGAKTGLSSTLLFRKAIGKYGTIVFSIILAFIGLGWFGVNIGMVSNTWMSVFPELSFPVATIIFGLCMCVTGVIGFKAMAVLSKVAVIPLIVFIVWGFIAMVGQVSFTEVMGYTPSGNGFATPGLAISAVYGSWALGAAIMSDVSRYAKPSFVKIVVIFGLGLFLGHWLLPIVAIFFALHLGTWDFAVITAHLAALTVGSVVVSSTIVSLAQWSTNDNNLYSASLALNNVLQIKAKWKVALVMGVCATLLGAIGTVNYFTEYMTLLGQIVPPMAAVTISHYLVLPALGLAEKMQLDEVPAYKSIPKVIWPAAIACIIGGVVGVTVSWFVPAINSLVVTVVCHVCLTYLWKGRAAKAYAG